MSSEQMEKRCSNCMHVRCLFYGENRTPVYTIRINCWDNAHEAYTRTAAQLAKGVKK